MATSSITSLSNSLAMPTMRADAKSTDSMVYNDLSALGGLKMQSRDDPEAAIKEVAKQFESLFTTMMMKTMRESIPEDSLFGGPGMQSYQEMHDQQLSLDLSKKGGLGLAKIIERQLSNVLASSAE